MKVHNVESSMKKVLFFKDQVHCRVLENKTIGINIQLQGCFFPPDVVLYWAVVVSARNSSLLLKSKYTGDATVHNNVWIHKGMQL